MWIISFYKSFLSELCTSMLFLGYFCFFAQNFLDKEDYSREDLSVVFLQYFGATEKAINQ